MKKSTISKLKSIFGSKKGKRQLQQQQSTKSSRSASPEPSGETSPCDGDIRPLMRTPPPTRAGPPPSPPVPTRPVAPVAPEPSGPLPLVPCQVCGRTFLPQSLTKHVKICEKTNTKKRKTFDSSRQRREGTDLEQYLPKNFGLPENSPFLEKSPPPTAKPTPKPKVQSVRSAITKPNAELQKCPHCNRAFGVRAFERHVEWCADKAKILPAAPAQPPPHIADAKQRLNARKQYKAPLARGRKSSQSRDKSSNSRSASVESSRGISPPREYGDYRHGRARASESASSNDCQEDTSPHVPVIRNSRNSQNSSGDANVKARQARLARDLSSSRNPKEPETPTIQQSNTDPNINVNEAQNKPRNRMNARKKQQLKKLEEIASKYSERNQDKREHQPLNQPTTKLKREKSMIPVLKKVAVQKAREEIQDDQFNEDRSVTNDEEAKEEFQISKSVTKVKDYIKSNAQVSVKDNRNTKESEKRSSKNFKNRSETLNDTYVNEKQIKNENKSKLKKKDYKKPKEISMSLDSLEEASINSALKCQSVGINTELLCVPCVIHKNADQKQCDKKTYKKNKLKEPVPDLPELTVEVIYKNPIVSPCDGSREILCESEDFEITESRFQKENLTTRSKNSIHSAISESNNSTELPYSSKELVLSELNLDIDEIEHNSSPIEDNANDDQRAEDDFKDEDIDYNDLPAEHLDEQFNNDPGNDDIFEDIVDHKSDTEANNEDIVCRYGSGETYTKFTENPDDLEEFLNLTDSMMADHNFQEVRFDIDKDLSIIDTPKTNSLEALNINESNKVSQPKYNFSDTFEELKANLKELLNTAEGDKAVKDAIQNGNLRKSNESNADREVCDMEHITVYELKLYEEKTMTEKKESLEMARTESPGPLKLPSIDKNNKPEKKLSCNKKRMQRIYKPNRKYQLLSDQKRNTNNQTAKMSYEEDSDGQSVSSEAPPLKLPRIENKKQRLDDNYDPFVSAARQMKELMSSDTNIPKKLSNSSKDLNRTLPILRNTKEKCHTSYNHNNTKMMKDTLNKSYQKTPTLQRMKSFGSTNNDNHSSFGGRCSSFRINRNDKKSSQKLNTTFTKSSKENISTVDNKSFFNRNSNLNRSFSSYTASNYSTPKLKEKIPKIATSMYHSFQRTTIKQPVKLDKIKRDDEKKHFVNLDSILGDDNSSVMTDSSYIDPRLINENDNLPINVNTILNNPDIISSMESLLTTENLPAKFESFSSSNLNNNIKNRNGMTNSNHKLDKLVNNNKITAPIIIDELSHQYDKIMSSLEQSITSKTSVRDDESLCEDFDLEEFMTSFDEEIVNHKLENKRTCSSTTRVVKQSELIDSNRVSEYNSVSPSPKMANGMIPVNKSMSLNFSTNNVNENLFPSSVKRSTSLLDSIQKKSVPKVETTRSRQKTDQLEQDLMQSLKDFDRMYASENNDTIQSKESVKYSSTVHGTIKRDTRLKPERKLKKDGNVTNGNYTPNGKSSNDSAYSSLNRISPSKLSLCATKEGNGLPSLEQAPGGSDSGKEDVRSVSSEEFLAMERSAELDEPLPQPSLHSPFKDKDNHAVSEKRVGSHASSRHSPTWRHESLSSSGSEASLPRAAKQAVRLSRFCHECGTKFSVDTAKFCIECGVKRLLI